LEQTRRCERFTLPRFAPPALPRFAPRGCQVSDPRGLDRRHSRPLTSTANGSTQRTGRRPAGCSPAVVPDRRSLARSV